MPRHSIGNFPYVISPSVLVQSAAVTHKIQIYYGGAAKVV
jgi:hypothetical protein